MALEVERKFLLADDSWRTESLGSSRIRDGLVVASDNGKVRVRIENDKASLTVKSPRTGLVRREFEYPIPVADAEEILHAMCRGATIEKTRYRVPYGGFTWSVDIHEGLLAGIGLAEIELQHPDQSFPKPPWIGREVTDDKRFHKSILRQLCVEAGHPLSVAELLLAKV